MQITTVWLGASWLPTGAFGEGPFEPITSRFRTTGEPSTFTFSDDCVRVTGPPNIPLATPPEPGIRVATAETLAMELARLTP